MAFHGEYTKHRHVLATARYDMGHPDKVIMEDSFLNALEFILHCKQRNQKLFKIKTDFLQDFIASNEAITWALKVMFKKRLHVDKECDKPKVTFLVSAGHGHLVTPVNFCTKAGHNFIHQTTII